MQDERPKTPPIEVGNDELRRQQDEVIARMMPFMEKATAYNSFIMGAGYAAFFTIWNGFRGKLPPGAILVSGGLIGISIGVFLLWELAKSQTQTRSAGKIGKAVQANFGTDRFWPNWHAAWGEHQRTGAALNRFQPLVFYTAAITGVLAAGILATSALVVGVPKYVEDALDRPPTPAATVPVTPPAKLP